MTPKMSNELKWTDIMAKSEQVVTRKIVLIVKSGLFLKWQQIQKHW